MKHIFEIDGMEHATIKESASLRYRGTLIEASRHRMKRHPDPLYDGRTWTCAGYVKVPVSVLPPEWVAVERGVDRYPEERWAAHQVFFPRDSPWNDLPFHGGVTYEDIESYGDGAFQQMRVGCDYGHLYDHYDPELEQILREMQTVVDRMCERLGVETLAPEKEKE
jgi:hypothetical protein